jgi:hypothetical protein
MSPRLPDPGFSDGYDEGYEDGRIAGYAQRMEEEDEED